MAADHAGSAAGDLSLKDARETGDQGEIDTAGEADPFMNRGLYFKHVFLPTLVTTEDEALGRLPWWCLMSLN